LYTLQLTNSLQHIHQDGCVCVVICSSSSSNICTRRPAQAVAAPTSFVQELLEQYGNEAKQHAVERRAADAELRRLKSLVATQERKVYALRFNTSSSEKSAVVTQFAKVSK